MPASTHASTKATPHAGASSDGFITTPLPASSAGKIFQLGMAIGKFQGVIIPTTPTGIRVVHAIFVRHLGRARRRPIADRPWPATKAAMSIASCTSPPPSMRILPASRLTSSASSALRAVRTAPTAAMASARSGHRTAPPTPAGPRSRAARRASTSAAACDGQLDDHLRRSGRVRRAERGHRRLSRRAGAMAVAPIADDRTIRCMPDLATRIDRPGRRAPARRAPGGGAGPGRSVAWPRSPPSPSSGAGRDTSGATVVRLADRLGYDGWVGLQADGPRRPRPPAPPGDRAHPRARRAATCSPRRPRREADNVHRTLDAVDRSAFDRAVVAAGRPPSSRPGRGRLARRTASARLLADAPRPAARRA